MERPFLADKIKALKERLGDLLPEDPKLSNQFYLAHWLRANKLDADRAEQAIRANRKWRREYDMDTLANKEPDENFKSKYPMFYDVRGKGGRPVIYLHATITDIPGLIKEFGKDETLRHIAHFLMILEKIVFDWDNEWKGSVDDMPLERTMGFFDIIDTEDFPFKSVMSVQVLTFMVDWTKLCVSYFPSVNRQCRVINASKLVEIPYKLVKPIVTSAGYDMTVLRAGASADEWQRDIFSVIEPSQFEELKARAVAMKQRRIANQT